MREKTLVNKNNFSYGSHESVVLLNVVSRQYEPKGKASRLKAQISRQEEQKPTKIDIDNKL